MTSESPPAERVASGSPPEGGKRVAPGKRSAARGMSFRSIEAQAGATEYRKMTSFSIALCMINVGTPFHIGKIPEVVAFSLLLSLCESLWKCEKSWGAGQPFPQKNTGGRKRTPFELRARPGGRSSARTPGSSRTGPCPFRSSTYRCKGERLGCGITLGGLP